MTPAEELSVRWSLKMAELKGWVDAMRWMADPDMQLTFALKQRLQDKFSEKQDEALKCATPEAMVANELMED